MPSKSPETTRNAILRASAALFATRGYHGTSTRDIAEVVGIRQPSLFHHFGSKTEIMVCLQELDLTPAVVLHRTALSLPGTAAERLYYELYAEIRRYLLSDFDFSGTTTPGVLNDPAFSVAAQQYAEIQKLQGELIGQGVDAGEFIEIDSILASRVVLWSFEGILIDWNRHAGGNAESLADAMASLSVRSLLADTTTLDDVRRSAMDLFDRVAQR